MEGKQAIKFDKYNSQAIKGIAIVMMLFHHMYLSQDRFEGLNVVFTPFSELSIEINRKLIEIFPVPFLFFGNVLL